MNLKAHVEAVLASLTPKERALLERYPYTNQRGPNMATDTTTMAASAVEELRDMVANGQAAQAAVDALGAGKPPPDDEAELSDRIELRCKMAERAAWEAAARERGLSLSAFIRHAARLAAVPISPFAPAKFDRLDVAVFSDVAMRAVYALERIGDGINAGQLNLGNALDTAVKLTAARQKQAATKAKKPAKKKPRGRR